MKRVVNVICVVEKLREKLCEKREVVCEIKDEWYSRDAACSSASAYGRRCEWCDNNECGTASELVVCHHYYHHTTTICGRSSSSLGANALLFTRDRREYTAI